MSGPSTTATFPAVDDTFSSIVAFKRVVYSAAVSASLTVHITTCTQGLNCGFRCGGGGSKRQIHDDGFKGCSCVVYARKDPKSKLYRVRRSILQHSCNLVDPMSEEGRAARMKMRAKLEALDDANEDGSRTRLVAAGSDETTTSTDDDSDDDGSPAFPTRTRFGRLSAKPEQHSMIPHNTKRPRLGETSNEQRRADEELKTASLSSYGSAPGSRRLSKRLLEKDIEALAKLRRLDLPSTSDLFPAALPLLPHIYAWATQRRLRINHNYMSSCRIVFFCRPNRDKPRCDNFKIEMRGEDDGWRLTEARLEHEDELHSREEDETDSASEASRVVSSSSASTSGALPFPHSRPPNSTPQLSILPSVPAPAALSLALAPEHFSAFLASLSSSSAFDPSALHFFLLTSGLSTISDLASLALLEEEAVVALVEAFTREQGLSDEEACGIVEGLQALRERFDGAMLEKPL